MPEMKTEPKQNRSSAKVRIALFALLVVVFGILFVYFRKQLSLDYLAEHEAILREYRESHFLLSILIAGLVYVVVAGFSLPGGATVLTVVYAWFFGFLPALVLVSFSSTAGATIAFLLSRYFFRESLTSRFGERLKTFNENLEKDGAFYLFTLRLIPAVPFFLINIVMGLTPIRTSTYWWVSQVGMLPGTMVYVFFGASFPDLQTLSEQGLAGVLKWEILVAFLLLGLAPLAIKEIYKRFRPNSLAVTGSNETDNTGKTGTQA